jgi:hypothetical protein
VLMDTILQESPLNFVDMPRHRIQETI